MLNNHKSSSNLNVGGKMSEKGADMVGLIVAISGLVLAFGIAIAVIILALSYTNK